MQYSQDKELRQTILQEAHSEAIKFIQSYLLDVLEKNMFTDTYGEARAESDGKCKLALDLINLTETLQHDRNNRPK